VELSGFAAGIEGNAVNGGDRAGSFGTAGTIPTMPPDAEGSEEVVPLT